jgi:hypothetical protein
VRASTVYPPNAATVVEIDGVILHTGRLLRSSAVHGCWLATARFSGNAARP